MLEETPEPTEVAESDPNAYPKVRMDDRVDMEICGPHLLVKLYPEKETAGSDGKIIVPDAAKKQRAAAWVVGASDEAEARGFLVKDTVLCPFHALNHMTQELGKGIAYVHIDSVVMHWKRAERPKSTVVAQTPLLGDMS